MSENSGAVVEDESVIIVAERVSAVWGLTGKRFVGLPQVDVADAKTCFARSFGTANTGPMPMCCGAQTATCIPP